MKIKVAKVVRGNCPFFIAFTPHFHKKNALALSLIHIFRDKVLDSVYIGGGTPTTLEPDQLRRLLSRLRETFDFSQVKEFTVEAGRADSITADKLRVLKEFGVTRISVNPQTMNQKTLDLIGRRHTVEQVKEAFALARQEGFDNINMDLILGCLLYTSRCV